MGIDNTGDSSNDDDINGGHDMRILVDIGGTELDLMVADDADLDGTFVGTCNDTGERLRVNGWLADEIEYV